MFLKGGMEVPILFLWAWGFLRLMAGSDTDTPILPRRNERRMKLKKRTMGPAVTTNQGTEALHDQTPFTWDWPLLPLKDWAPPRVVWKKVTRAMRAMRGNAVETVPFQPSFGYTKSFLEALSNQYFQAARAMRAKQALTVPLQPYFGFH